MIYFLTFFPQTILNGDTSDHISFAKDLFSGTAPAGCYTYPLFYVCIVIFGKIFGSYSIGTAVLIGLFAAVTCFLQIKVLHYFLKDDCSSWKIALYGFALSFIWPLNFVGYDNPYSLYLFSGATAPVHNATYLASKPFALACFFLFYIMMESAAEEAPIHTRETAKKQNLRLLLFSVLFFLSVLAKPNFYQIFAPAGTLIAICCFLRYGRRIFLFCCKLAAAFVPATLWTIYTMTVTVGGIRFAPLEGFRIRNSDPLSLAVIQSILFVIFVIALLFIYRENWKLLLFASIVWVFSAAEFYLFIQSDHPNTLDLGWGYLCAQYLLFAAAAISFEKIRPRIGLALYRVGVVLFAAHFATGIYAFSTFAYSKWAQL